MTNRCEIHNSANFFNFELISHFQKMNKTHISTEVTILYTRTYNNCAHFKKTHPILLLKSVNHLKSKPFTFVFIYPSEQPIINLSCIVVKHFYEKKGNTQV